MRHGGAATARPPFVAGTHAVRARADGDLATVSGPRSRLGKAPERRAHLNAGLCTADKEDGFIFYLALTYP